MTLELVVVDETGKEVDWIDPVTEVTAVRRVLYVCNGYGSYTAELFPGYQAIIRERKS